MEKFKCSYYGIEHDTLEGMARCILVCSERIEREEEQQRKAELIVEQDENKKIIMDMVKNYNNVVTSTKKEILSKISEYNNKYNTPITLTSNSSIFNSLNHLFW